MTTPEKSEAILRTMLELANSGRDVIVMQDLGGNSATVVLRGEHPNHAHVGIPEGDWDTFVDELHALLCEGRGLSWA